MSAVTARLRGEPPRQPTHREMEVVRAILVEGSVKEAAHVLGISYATTRNHLTNLYDKVGLNDQQAGVYNDARKFAHAVWRLRYELDADMPRPGSWRLAGLVAAMVSGGVVGLLVGLLA